MYDLCHLAEQNMKLELMVQVSAFASGCLWRAQTLGSSAGSPAAWSPPAHTEEKKKKKLSKALLQYKLTWKKHVFVVFFQHSSFFSWNIRPVNAWVTPQTGRVIKTIAKLYTEVNKNILVSSSHLCPDLLQLLLPLAELCLQVWGPPLSHLLLPVQLQSALLQHSLQLRLLLQQQAPAPSTTHKYNVPCWALQGGCF